MANSLTQHPYSTSSAALTDRIGRRLERFDLLTVGVIAILSILIGSVILGGDRAGVGVTLGTIAGTAIRDQAAQSLTIAASDSLHLNFSEPMARNTVHPALNPTLPFTLNWLSSTEAVLIPAPAFTPGQPYTVTLAAGAQAANGRPVQGSPYWTIAAEALRVVYLAPAQRVPGQFAPTNLWLVAPGDQAQAAGQMAAPVRLTDSALGVTDFAVSPDGRQIAYSQTEKGHTSNVYVLDMGTRTSRPLTNCPNAPCNAPAWSPDGSRLIYQRADATNDQSPTRAWLLDVKTLQTAPVFSDAQWLGKDPHWSSDGHTISVYDSTARAVDLIDLDSGQHSFLPTEEDYSGQFAPGGRPQLAMTDLSTTPYGVARHLEIADYSAHTLTSLAPTDGTLVDDQSPSWSPDGRQLAIMRHALDSASPGAQIYLIDVQSGAASPLVTDDQYAHGALSWSPDGGQLLFQRYPVNAANGQTGIWTYTVFSKHLTQIATNGYYPQWLP